MIRFLVLLVLMVLSACSNGEKKSNLSSDKNASKTNESNEKAEEFRLKNQLKRARLEKTSDLEGSYFYSKNQGSPISIPVELKWSSSNTLQTFSIQPQKGTRETELKKILIYSSNQLVQTIEHNGECLDFELMDWNFDGYNDISVLFDAGATGNTSYRVWFYNKMKGVFEIDKDFLEGSNFIDTIQKYVVHHYRQGGDSEFWGYYKYKNNKLVFHHAKVIQFLRYGEIDWKKFTRTVMKGKQEVVTSDSVQL